MPGTAVAIGVMGCATTLALGLATAGAAAVVSQRTAAAADAAALAAADAASGAASGIPCDRASELAEAGAARLVLCEVDGLIATVTVESRFAGLPVSARARAGPPPQVRR